MVHAGLIMTIPIPNLGERGGVSSEKALVRRNGLTKRGRGGLQMSGTHKQKILAKLGLLPLQLLTTFSDMC